MLEGGGVGGGAGGRERGGAEETERHLCNQPLCIGSFE